jgi:transposase
MSFYRNVVSRGKKYRQLVESRWDSEKKQSRIHVIKHLGTVVEKDGKEELQPSQLKFDSMDKIYPVGKLALFWKVAEEFEVGKSISKVIGKDDKGTSMALLILIFNQLLGRKPLSKIQQWISETPIPRWTDIDVKVLTKDYFLSSLDKISHENPNLNTSYSYSIQNNITHAWRKIIGNEPERFFFFQDITRIRWNGDQSYWAENGYGAQTGRPHLGFGLVISKDNYMPVMGYPVRGSNPDLTTVEETINNLNRWNMKKITLVWDRGFVSKPNVNYAREKHFHVLSAGSHTSKEVEDWITKYDDSDIERRENILSKSKGNAVYCIDNIGNLYGGECKIVIMLDPQKRNRSRVERDLILQQLESETSKKKIAELKKGLSPVVNLAKGRRGYEIDVAEEELARKLDGRSLFFSTDIKMSGKDIVRTYFQKDHIEKAFRFLKGDACLSPVRYQQPGRVEVYLSVINFIAYELIAAVLWKIKKHKIDMSYGDLMECVSKIYEVELISKNSKIYRWNHISKDTEKILKQFNVLSLQP